MSSSHPNRRKRDPHFRKITPEDLQHRQLMAQPTPAKEEAITSQKSERSPLVRPLHGMFGLGLMCGWLSAFFLFWLSSR